MSFFNLFKNKTVLVTGHTGFKGSWLTSWLVLLGAKVIGLSINIPTTPSHFKATKLQEKINHKELFYPKETTEYIYSNGWNSKGLFSIIIGFIFSASTIWNVNLTSLQSFAWIIGAFVSFILYYLINNK